MNKSVIYIHGQLLKASTKCVKALDYIDVNKSLTKTEMRAHLKGIFKDLQDAIGVPTKYDTPNHETKEEREKMPEEYHKSIDGFDLPDDF